MFSNNNSNTSAASNITEGLPSNSVLIPYSIVLSLLLVPSLIINSISFIIFLKKRELLANPFHKLLFNYIIASFSTTLSLMPTSLSSLIAKRWVLGEMMCQSTGILSVSLVTAAMLSLGSIAFDRYHFIVNPLTYPLNMTPFKVNVIMFFIWFISIVSGLMPLFGWGKYTFNTLFMTCTVNWGSGEKFGLYFVLIGYIFPLLLQAFCYGNIIKVAKKHSKFGRRMSRVAIMPLQVARIIRETSATKTIGKTCLVLGVFLLTCLPNSIMILIMTFSEGPQTLASSALFTSWLSYLSFLLYPILFVFRARALKIEVGLLLSKSKIIPCLNRVEPLDIQLPIENNRRKSSLSLDSYDFNTRRRSSKVSRVSWALPIVIEDGIEPSAEPRSSLTGSTVTTDMGSATTGSLLPGEIDHDSLQVQARLKTKMLNV